MLSLVPANIEHDMDFNQLTDNTVEKLFSLTNAAFEVIMMLTEPELAGLLALTLPVNAQIIQRFWTITMTSVSGNSTVIDGTAAISKLNVIDAGVGFATVEFTLDFVSTATVTPAVAGVTVIP